MKVARSGYASCMAAVTEADWLDEQRVAYGEPAVYRGPQVCREVGITYRQLDYWDRTGLASPSLAAANGPGTQRGYSDNDLRRLRTIKALLDAGLSLQSIREIADAFVFDQADTGYLVVGDGRASLVQTGDEIVRELLARDSVVHVVRVD